MNSDTKNFYSLLPNYAALRELEEKNYHKPTEEEVQNFLQFWSEVYQIWRKNYPDKIDWDKINHKAEIRKLLNKIF